jgi:hypothetical protein
LKKKPVNTTKKVPISDKTILNGTILEIWLSKKSKTKTLQTLPVITLMLIGIGMALLK